MEYTNPLIKVTWADTPEAFTPERIKRVKEYFKDKYNTRHVKIITKIHSNGSNAKLKSLEVSDSITDPNYQKTLMKDFVIQNNIKTNIDYLDRLDNKVNEEIFNKEENHVKYNRWYIKNVEFSNFLSFGDNNVIDFTGLEGITVVESTPKNFGGKSTSTVDLLLFLFFNTTTKTKTNAEVFNRFTSKDSVEVKGRITIDGDDYIIERTITRKKGRTEAYTVKTDLQFSKVLPNGDIQNLAGEQRRETEQFITKAIGTQEDFLSTILTTGYNLEELIDSKPTARGAILTKFMGLDTLKEKESVCKVMYNEYSRTMVSNTHNAFTLENQNVTFSDTIIDVDKTIVIEEKKLNDTTVKSGELVQKKESLLSEKHNDIDQSLFKTNVQTLTNEIGDINVKIKKIEETLKTTVVVEPKEYYYEDKHDTLKDKIRDLNYEIKEGGLSINKVTTHIKHLTDGSVCSECKRPLENVDHTKEIDTKKLSIVELEESIKKTQVLLDESIKSEVVLSTLKKGYDAYEKNKLISAKYELEIDQKKLELDAKTTKIDYYEANKIKHERNIQIDKELVILRTQIETADSNIKQSNIQIERFRNEIKNLKEKIAINKELITKIKNEEQVQLTYKTYLSVFGKNGISKTILRDMIPLLNNELSMLLDDSCYFKLEVNINEKNELDFVMIDSDTRVVKPLNSGSGYERTIASLALRAVLTKVSALPKPNIVVMDEVFGKIADENLEMVGEFFKKIKEYFENIFVISHNPLIRTWSDNLLMVKKEENVSVIESVTTKIS